MSASDRPALVRGLGTVEATTIILGGVIGSGIFLAPALVANNVGSPARSLAVWAVAGILATAGGLCYAEMAAAIPESGGTYQYLKRTYRSPLLAFLAGWMFFFVDGPGSLAAVATAFATYAGVFLKTGPTGTKVLAAGVLMALVVVNVLGVRTGGRVQNVMTGLKVLALLAVIAVPLSSGAGSWNHFAAAGREPAQGALAAVGAAIIPASFAYSGWTFTSYLGAEFKDPGRAIPRGIIWGMGAVIVIYLAVNVAFLYVLPFERLAASTVVASDAMGVVLGERAADLVAVAIMLSTLGALNAAVLAFPRMGYALAKDGLFFRSLERVHPRFHTPAAAIVVQGLIACAFIASGSYERILGYFGFTDFLAFGLVVLGVMVLRRREPNLPRPYRVFGYPLTPLLFLALCVGYLGTVLIGRPVESLIGVALTLTGIPFYLWWRRRPRRDTI
jgi:APA family basic amino acid/polyamine antiporter